MSNEANAPSSTDAVDETKGPSISANIPTEANTSSSSDGEVLNETKGPSSLSVEEEIRLADLQQNAIMEEQQARPLVGEKVSFESVLAEYSLERSPEFYTKAFDLSNTYRFIRNIRRDGNCFYRSMLLAETELMYADPDERARFDSVCRGWKDRLIKLGFPDFTTTDFCDVFYEFLDTVQDKDTTFQDQITLFLDDNRANYLIIFLRLITSGYIKENEGDYAPFVDGDRSLSEYCVNEIEQMWKDADHLAITGFVAATGVPVRVEYLDQCAAPNGGCHYDFPPEQSTPPRINLLYRPGHYDIIYRS